MLITLYKIGELQFRLLGTNGFHVKAKTERFTAASSRCRQNLKYENFTSSLGRLRQNNATKSVPHVQHDYFSSLNQSNHWFVALSFTLQSSNLKLPNGSRRCADIEDIRNWTEIKLCLIVHRPGCFVNYNRFSLPIYLNYVSNSSADMNVPANYQTFVYLLRDHWHRSVDTLCDLVTFLRKVTKMFLSAVLPDKVPNPNKKK